MRASAAAAVARCAILVATLGTRIAYASWPNGPDVHVGGTFTIDAKHLPPPIVPDVILPDNFTIVVAPEITFVHINATRLLQFGKNCTIDLAPKGAVPAKPAGKGGAGGPGPNSWGKPGAIGPSGDSGVDGPSGMRFVLSAPQVVDKGSLWIRTDGGSGGDGGDGGRGGDGGGYSCGPRQEPRTDGGVGGNGGVGGLGGNGGSTALVELDVPNAKGVFAIDCGTPGPPSTRPAGSDPASDDGSIYVSGNPGAGGRGGNGGAGGSGGDRGRTKGCTVFEGGGDVHGGPDGKEGAQGVQGSPGLCKPPVVHSTDTAAGRYAAPRAARELYPPPRAGPWGSPGRPLYPPPAGGPWGQPGRDLYGRPSSPRILHSRGSASHVSPRP